MEERMQNYSKYLKKKTTGTYLQDTFFPNREIIQEGSNITRVHEEYVERRYGDPSDTQTLNIPEPSTRAIVYQLARNEEKVSDVMVIPNTF